jgi:hypothetical protein
MDRSSKEGNEVNEKKMDEKEREEALTTGFYRGQSLDDICDAVSVAAQGDKRLLRFGDRDDEFGFEVELGDDLARQIQRNLRLRKLKKLEKQIGRSLE